MAFQLSGAQPGLTAELTRAHTGTPARPAFAIQVNALQAMCRQVFGFRLAMIAIATPYAISHTAPGLPTWFIGSAILVTFMGSYLLFRDWERFGPVLLRHPWLLAVDVFFGGLLLITATPESTLAYVTVCTPMLAGLVQGWRGAAIFAALQVVIVFGVYASVPKLEPGGAPTLLLPGFCVIAGAVGVTLRNLLLRFGTATQALTETRARLAVNEAVEGERTRLAREMHDSVAKTLHGLALAADGLAGSADRMDPPTVKLQAELVARAARRAAAESRELLTDLRREQGLEGGVDLLAELAAHAEDFTRRHPVTATFHAARREDPGPARTAGGRQAAPHRRLRGPGERPPPRRPLVPDRPRGRAGRHAPHQRVRRRARPARRNDARHPPPGRPTSASSAWSSARPPSGPASGSAGGARRRAPRYGWSSPWRR